MNNLLLYQSLRRLNTLEQTLSPAQAVELQEAAAGLIIQQPFALDNISFIAGADVSVKGDMAQAALVVMRMDDFSIIETQTLLQRIDFPYIPGLLAFREAPLLIQAFKKLVTRPDLTLVDGQGLCHPRFFGLASHFGVAMDIPTIGVAKSRLVGDGPDPGPQKGDMAPVSFKGRQVAMAMRSRAGVKPVYISIGHRMDLPSAARIVLRCLTKYRLPEPIRAAHRAAGAWPE